MTRLAAVVLGVALGAGCGGRHAFDARAMVTKCGLDCAVDEARFRLAKSPRDRDVWVALAILEEERGRPGAAIDALDKAEQLGRAFRGGLGEGEAKRLGALLVERAKVRAARGSPDAEADVARAKALGVSAPPALVKQAAIAAIAGDLRHTDPDRRARGRKRLVLVEPAWAAALAGDGDPVVVATVAEWLESVRAYRTMLEMLDERVRLHGVESLRDAPGAANRWLLARRWWGGPEGRPDLVTLGKAEAFGAGPCWFPRAGGACSVVATGGAKNDGGTSWEPALVTHWERDGVRAATADEAAAWMIVASRAEHRVQIGSYERAVRDHVDVAALAQDARAPAWARKEAARIDAGEPREVPDFSRIPLPAGARVKPPWPEQAATLATYRSPDVSASRIRAVADAYAVDPALADRRAEDVLAVGADVAATAPVLGRLFSLLGDPARARAMWQRAADASPEDADLALELAIAMAEANDPAAGLVQMIRAAAGHGDAGTAMLVGARGFGAAGHTVEALTLARSALSLSAPGDEAPAAAVAAALLEQLDRTADAAALRALAPLPVAWDGRDAAAAVAAAVSDASHGLATDRGLVGWNRLVALATSSDRATARLAARAIWSLR
ncbi:MAG TPA: hypothetical protein VM261_05180 [Kofleriaceae bacterium]|nr:hypothetical protein [Kofleriaceae bacterium]